MIWVSKLAGLPCYVFVLVSNLRGGVERALSASGLDDFSVLILSVLSQLLHEDVGIVESLKLETNGRKKEEAF
jgi:hypothetical protein